MKTGVILARFRPIHNGHLQLISKAVEENDQVLVIIGSIDKLNARNPIPWTIRKEMVEEAIGDTFLAQGNKEKISATEVRELILNGRLPIDGVVPESVYNRRETIKAFLNVFKK